MVRINLIKPNLLTDQHLIAEQVEILMLTEYIKRHPVMDDTEPKEFTLNKGHMKFFRNKVLYLRNRYNDIHSEMINREFNHEWKFPSLNLFPENLLNDYKPKQKDYDIILERIFERIGKKPEWYRYHKTPLTVNYLNNINNFYGELKC